MGDQSLDLESWWAFHRSEFEWMAENIRNVVFQTKEEAIKGEWFGGGSEYDEETGALKVGIPYSSLTEDDHLPSQIDYARSIIPDLERLFEERELTPDLLTGYVALAEIFGFVSAIAMADEDVVKDERRQRWAAARSKRTDVNRWVAKHVVGLLDEGIKRKRAEFLVAKGLRTFFDEGEAPPSFDAKRFQRALREENGHSAIVTSIDRDHMSETDLRALVNDASIDIPAFEVPIPKA